MDKIRIRDDVLQVLNKNKRPGESYSDVIMRLLGKMIVPKKNMRYRFDQMELGEKQMFDFSEIPGQFASKEAAALTKAVNMARVALKPDRLFSHSASGVIVIIERIK